MSKIEIVSLFFENVIIIPHHDGGCKEEFEIINRPAINRVSVLFDKLEGLWISFSIGNAVFVDRVAWKINTLVPDYTCPA